MDIVLNKVHEIILLNFSANQNNEARFGFERIINSMTWPLGHSLLSNPNIISNKNIQKHWEYFKIDLLLYRYKLLSTKYYISKNI